MRCKKIYIFASLFFMPLVGMDIEPFKRYEDGQKKLLPILYVFSSLQKVGLPSNLIRKIVSNYLPNDPFYHVCKAEVEQSKKLLEENMQAPLIKKYLWWFDGKVPYSLSDLFFLDKDQREGMLTIHNAWFNNTAAATRPDLTTEQERQKTRTQQSYIDESSFEKAMRVPLCLREKVFAGLDSGVPVFMDYAGFQREMRLRRCNDKNYYSLELIKSYIHRRFLLGDQKPVMI